MQSQPKPAIGTRTRQPQRLGHLFPLFPRNNRINTASTNDLPIQRPQIELFESEGGQPRDRLSDASAKRVQLRVKAVALRAPVRNRRWRRRRRHVVVIHSGRRVKRIRRRRCSRVRRCRHHRVATKVGTRLHHGSR